MGILPGEENLYARNLKVALRARVDAILIRHIRVEDALLSDRDLILKVYERYQKYLAEPLIAPDE